MLSQDTTPGQPVILTMRKRESERCREREGERERISEVVTLHVIQFQGLQDQLVLYIQLNVFPRR